MSCKDTCCFDCRKQATCTLARKCYGKKDPKCVDWVGEIPCSQFEVGNYPLSNQRTRLRQGYQKVRAGI